MKSLSSFPGGSKKNPVKLFDPNYYGCDVRKQIAAESLHTGMLGVEIELEGERLPDTIAFNTPNASWVYHADGSLRHVNGVDRGGAEYVLSAPCDLDVATTMVEGLFAELRAKPRTTIQNSYRCSTHVHVNMRGLKLNSVASFVVLWGMFEDILAEYCGEGRSGNLFALRLSDSSYAVDRWVSAFKTGDFAFNRDHRYLALNPACLRTFGSLEVRTMRGIDSAADLIPWMQALVRLREVAASIEDPTSIAMDFSGLGGVGMLERTFADLPILADLLALDNVDKRIRRGFRIVQPIVYALPWDHVLPEIKRVFIPDPFPMPKAKKAKSLRFAEEILTMAAPQPARWLDTPAPDFNDPERF